jgi:transposase
MFQLPAMKPSECAMATAAVHQAYRFALDPTAGQRRRLASAVDGARFAYNIRHLAVLSTGEQIPNPRPLERLQRKRRRLQRQWNRQNRERLASGRTHPGRRQQQTRRRITAVEARAACIRRDGLHKR